MYLLRFCQLRILPHLWCPQSLKPETKLTSDISTCSLLIVMIFASFLPFFFLSPKRPLIQLRSTMTCFHIPYLIFHLLLVISVRRRTRSSRITRARDFWPMGRQYRGLSILERYRHPLQGSRPKPWQSPAPRLPTSPLPQHPPRSPTTVPSPYPTRSSPPKS